MLRKKKKKKSVYKLTPVVNYYAVTYPPNPWNFPRDRRGPVIYPWALTVYGEEITHGGPLRSPS